MEGSKTAQNGTERPFLPPLGSASVAAPAGTTVSPSLSPLRPREGTSRRLAAVSTPRIQISRVLLPLEPTLSSEQLRPASFANVKSIQRSLVVTPSLDLQPVRLISEASARAARRAWVDAPAPTSEAPVAAAPLRRSLETSRLETSRVIESIQAAARLASPPRASDANGKSNSEPLWHQLFSPEKRAAASNRLSLSRSEDPAPHYSSAIEESGFDWGDAGGIELDGLPESKSDLLPFRNEEPRKIWFWQAIEGVFLSRAFSGALATVMVVLFASTIDVPWNEWARRQAAGIKAPLAEAVATLSHPIEERAAFFIIDDFTSGNDQWERASALRIDPAGWASIGQGLNLHKGTTTLTDYRLDFDAKIQNRAVGWVVRAPDASNHYGFKLLQEGSVDSPNFSLSRYSMIDGVKSVVSQRIDVPAQLASVEDFNRISVRVVNDQITTLLNGYGVDFWRDNRIEQGGVGLLAEAGESALVRKMTVSGNDDPWGLLLYGTLETMRSVEGFFGGEAASPATLVFFRVPAGFRTSTVGGPVFSPTYRISAE